VILYINKAQWTDSEHSSINARVLTDTYNMLCDYYFIPADPEFQEIVDSGFNIEEPYTPSLEELRVQKLTELNSLAFELEQTENKNMVVTSSLGYRVNADPKAKRNIDTLIELEVPTFRDYDNEIHLDMTIDKLKTIKREISMNAINLYNQKWVMEKEIKSLKTVEELNNYHIIFEMLNFN
jgi:hypothetical protein